MVEPTAYGLLGLRPWELDRLTLKEVEHLADWAQWREDRTWSLAAWVCANLMNATGNMKRPVTAEILLGPGFRAKQEARERRLMKQDEE